MENNIVISIGSSRKATNWKVQVLSWTDLVERLKENYRTTETAVEFKKMSKSMRDDIKDIGGFVGGELKNGRRKSANVLSRSLITLDADYADDSFVDRCAEVLSSVTYCIYSTHSHTDENKRFRLIIPFNDKVIDVNKYEAISRKIAANIGIYYFDDTTYQAARLMYWPSSPSDVDPVCISHVGDAIDAEDFLESEYQDWRDIAQWPRSAHTKTIFSNKLKRQQDPLTKEGVIGTFCRGISMTECLETYLSDVYESFGTSGDRYTYIDGSSQGGLVVYDDKFCYSNHATDPASMQLCNAFDIVRVHMFESVLSDEGTDPGKIKNESMRQMLDWAVKQDFYKRQAAKDRLDSCLADFGMISPSMIGMREKKSDKDGSDTENTEKIDEFDYESKLTLDKQGCVEKTARNVNLILHNDPMLKGKIAYDAFTDRIEVRGSLPWRQSKVFETLPFGDADLSGLKCYLDERYGLRRCDALINDVFAVYLKNVTYHSLRAYLDGLKGQWDGEERMDTVFIDFLGAEDDDYVRSVTHAILVAAVKRVYEPGCKFDEAIILVGAQGIGKSTILNKLGKTKWFSDSLNAFTSKDAVEQLPGNWIIELGELTALNRSEAEQAKAFLSRQVDSCRPAYGRLKVDRPRECVFFGTTNNETFLRDRTGNRRYWPVEVNGGSSKNLWEDFDESYVDQLWAEAVFCYAELGDDVVPPKDIFEKAEQVREEHEEINAAAEALEGLAADIEDYLLMPVPDNWRQMSTTEHQFYIQDYSQALANGRADEYEVGTKMKNGHILVHNPTVSVKNVLVDVFGRGVTEQRHSGELADIKKAIKAQPGFKKRKTKLRMYSDIAATQICWESEERKALNAKLFNK